MLKSLKYTWWILMQKISNSFKQCDFYKWMVNTSKTVTKRFTILKKCFFFFFFPNLKLSNYFKEKLSPQAKHWQNVHWAAAVQLPPTIANFKTWGTGSWENKEFKWNELNYSNCNLLPSLVARKLFLQLSCQK